MKLHLVTGFLGSGKTTAIRHAATLLLKENYRVGVITNDQGSRLVDGDLFSALGIPGRQVPGGCFCCNYGELDATIQSLVQSDGTSIIFAEAVGSCTDIVATVFKPLLQFHPGIQVTVSTFTDIRLLKMILDGSHSFDETVTYIYRKQLEEAEVVIVNKTDLVSGESIHTVRQQLEDNYPGKIMLFQDSQQEPDIRRWLGLLESYQREHPVPSLDIDYDVYAAGEARMAWHDQQLEVYTENNNALQITEGLANAIYTEIEKLNCPIGHIKFLVDSKTKISFTMSKESPVTLPIHPASFATLLVNIRVQASPDVIGKLVAGVITRFEQHCRIVASEAHVFSPQYPRPVYRMQ